jgi:hypothetical protein
MMRKTIVNISLFLAFSLILSACANAAPTQDPGQLATQVAAQVEAQVATKVAQALAAIQTQQQALPTNTPLIPTMGPIPTFAPVNSPTVSLPGLATTSPCNPPPNAISESHPDGTSVPINTAFDKSWTIQNAGTCTWNANYKIKFVSGDAMSGPAFKLFGASVRPGESIKLILPLKTPGAVGTTTGYWGLYDDKDVSFGRVWVTINSTLAPKVMFRVTSVLITKGSGCNFLAAINVAGTGDVSYTWKTSTDNISFDRRESSTKTFDVAGSQTVSTSVAFPNNTKYVHMFIDIPNNVEFGSSTAYPCP